MHVKTPLEFYFMHLGNYKIYHIFKTCYTISVLFSADCFYFVILSISLQVIRFS